MDLAGESLQGRIQVLKSPRMPKNCRNVESRAFLSRKGIVIYRMYWFFDQAL